MNEVRPNTGLKNPDPLQALMEKRKGKSLPILIQGLLAELLTAFEYDEGKKVNVLQHVVDADIDTALGDVVAMKTFFGMYGNKFEQKEDAVDELIRRQADVELQKGGKVTEKKAKARQSSEYKELIKKKLRYAKMRRDCRVLEKAMEMRLEVARSKSANMRFEMQPGIFQHNPM